MLALIAGTGALPKALLDVIDGPVLVCAMRGFVPEIPVDIGFRIEHLGSFLSDLRARGVTQVCFAGAVNRPVIDPAQIDPQTAPLIPVLQAAMAQGDDGALRGVIALFERAGFVVRAAHKIAPKLLPSAAVLTKAQPDAAMIAAVRLGVRTVARMGDTGQACIIFGTDVAREGPDGTDALLARAAPGAILFKAPKPAQDRRADLPVIGLGTAKLAVERGLAGIVIAAGGVMVLDLPGVVAQLDAAGLVLWVRSEDGE